MNIGRATHGIVLAGSLAVTGCGSGIRQALSSAGSPTTTTGSLGKISGRAFGGQQPVAGSQVYVYSVSTGGYGGASTSLLTASNGTGVNSSGNYYVTTAADGSFTVASAVGCAAGTQAYLYSTGGNPGYGANTAAGFMAPLGVCASNAVSPPSSYVTINEVSTVVTAYALAGFATDPTHISSSSTTLAATGVSNAMATALNILNLGTGTVSSVSGTGNAVLPVAKIDTLANILASCVNTTGPSSAACTKLRTDTSTSTDTAAAAIAMAHAPFTGVSDLYTLSSSNADFLPALSSSPPDFTIGLQYQTPMYQQNLTATTKAFATAYSAAFDSAGNLWTRATNDKDTTSTVNSVTTLVKYGPTGSMLDTITLSGNSNSYSPFVHLGIDSADDVWSGLAGGVLKYSSAGALLSPATGYTCPGMGTLTSTVFAPTGTVYAGDFGVGTIWELSSGGACSGSVTAGSSTFTGYLAIEKTGDVISSGSLNNNNAVYRFVPGASTYTSFDAGGDFITTDNLGHIWGFSTIGGSAADLLNEYTADGIGLTFPTGNNAGGLTQSGTLSTRAGQEGVHVDGSGAVWVGVNPCTYTGSNTCTKVADIIVGLTNSGTPITPSTGLVLPYSETGAHALALDGSGNLWAIVADGSLLQFVGLTTPVATPVLADQLGEKP